MLEKLKNWKGALEIDGVTFEHISQIPSDLKLSSSSVIILNKTKERSASQDAKASTVEYVVTVRQYMTKQATPSFDFMAKLNNNIPMPMRIMVGSIEKETPGMYYMKLKGDIIAEQIQVCMKCGKLLTNPVSKFFGMGPKCGNHNYINPFETEEELKEAVSDYKLQLNNITWEGWIIKSAITNMEEVQNERDV